MIDRLCAGLVAGAVPAAAAQVVNGDFETGSFTPWVLTDTPAGGSLFTDVAVFDIDGPGGRAPSNAARFMVGRRGPGTGAGGIVLSQEIPLPGDSYSFSAHWAVHPLISGTPVSGGIFELLLDGRAIARAEAPVSRAGVRTYGLVGERLFIRFPGPHTLAVRITRAGMLGEEIFQYVDDVSATFRCYPDCDTTTGVGVLDIFDFLCFYNYYDRGSLYACDCDTSTGPGVCDVFDFLCYQNEYDAGCRR